MNYKKLLLFIPVTIFWLYLLNPFVGLSQNTFTQKDRELLIEVKLKLYEMEKRLDQTEKRIEERFDQTEKNFKERFELADKRTDDLRSDMNSRFEQMFTFLWIITGLFTFLSASIISFAIWDRRTMTRPFETKIKEIEKKVKEVETSKIEKIESILLSLRELGKTDIKLAQVLKQFNLL